MIPGLRRVRTAWKLPIREREFSPRIVPDEKRSEEWAVLMEKGNGVGYIDRVHEWRRRHPLTVEVFEHKYRVFQLSEDSAYGGECSGGQYWSGFSLRQWFLILTLLLQIKSSSTRTTSATAGRTD